MDSIPQNLDSLRKRLESAEIESGRTKGSVTLIAVSKTKPLELILKAHGAGQIVFGENRVAEALEKFTPPLENQQIHMIGHLQGNKVEQAVGFFDLIHSVDSLKLLKKIDKSAEKKNLIQNVLIQVNPAGEESKEGYRSLDLLLKDLEILGSLKHVQLLGLMNIAPFSKDEKVISHSFSKTRLWLERMNREAGLSMTELSMGMTGDFVTAIAEGATMVRVGSAIFGSRDYP